MARKPKLPRLLRIREVAQMLNVNPETLRRWDRQGKFKAIRIDSRGDRRYRSDEILKMIEKI
jgi:excisionase family DNA binding protein